MLHKEHAGQLLARHRQEQDNPAVKGRKIQTQKDMCTAPASSSICGSPWACTFFSTIQAIQSRQEASMDELRHGSKQRRTALHDAYRAAGNWKAKHEKLEGNAWRLHLLFCDAAHSTTKLMAG